MSAEFEVKGLADLNNALDEFPDQLQRNALRGALRAAAKVIADEAKARVPVITGALRKSIRVSVRIVDGIPVASIKAGNRVSGGSQKTGAERGAFYAHMVEFGTAAHLIRSIRAKSLKIGGWFAQEVMHPGAEMHPFFRPAISTKTEAAIAKFADYVRGRLDKLKQADNES